MTFLSVALALLSVDSTSLSVALSSIRHFDLFIRRFGSSFRRSAFFPSLRPSIRRSVSSFRRSAFFPSLRPSIHRSVSSFRRFGSSFRRFDLSFRRSIFYPSLRPLFPSLWLFHPSLRTFNPSKPQKRGWDITSFISEKSEFEFIQIRISLFFMLSPYSY
ncbi:hypothetical protein [Lysinibacillus sp. JNUCC 51]|uniref:hypothetical protein n=1 Tax=Lysinibacillus sp. JNUCC-51 TaxID=2792479 RepID=UPI0019368D59|nr:hypothetical protein JNUCC51_09035 [Lysinibacillus sp. JNUCC-51]